MKYRLHNTLTERATQSELSLLGCAVLSNLVQSREPLPAISARVVITQQQPSYLPL